MFKARRTAFLIISTLLSATGFADDAKFSNPDSESLPVVTLSAQTLLAGSKYGSRWPLFHPDEAIAYSDDWPPPIAELDFQDTGALVRASKLRNLSLLTLAEVGRSRLFLGVNEEGFVGLHFRAFPRYADERYAEVVRMPYLEDNKPDSELEQLEPESL